MTGRMRLTIVVGVLGLALLSAGIWFVVLSPRLSEASRLDQQAVDLETANLGLLNTYNRSLELAREVPQSAAAAQQLFEAMPREADLPRVLEQLTDAAVAAGMDPKDVQTINATVPAPVVDPTATGAPGVALAQLQVTVTALGSRDQALAFLDSLQALERELLVTSTRLTEAPVQEATDQWSVQVTSTLFVLQSELPDLVQQVEDLLAEADLPSQTG